MKILYTVVYILICVGLQRCTPYLPEGDPEPKLLEGVSQTVQKMYSMLGTECDGKLAASQLRYILPSLVIVYLETPCDDDSRHTKGEWRVHFSSGPRNWGVTVYPYRRSTIDGRVYELWVAAYCLVGHDGPCQRPHREYFGTVTSGRWGEREIIVRFGKRIEELTAPYSILDLSVNGTLTTLDPIGDGAELRRAT